MSARQSGPYAAVARKWLALAERRRAHLIELRDSGRWKHYYKETELAGHLAEIDVVCARFANIAGTEPPILEAPPVQGPAFPAAAGVPGTPDFLAALELALGAASALQQSAANSPA
jgi:hypothetical protein